MSKDGSDNLRKNLSKQFPMSDPRRFGFAGQARPTEVADLHPVGYASRRTVNLHDPVWATQDYIDPAKVARFSDRRPRRKEPPWLVEHEGKTFVWDGHHSIAAALSKGQRTMRVQVSRPMR